MCVHVYVYVKAPVFHGAHKYARVRGKPWCGPIFHLSTGPFVRSE